MNKSNQMRITRAHRRWINVDMRQRLPITACAERMSEIVHPLLQLILSPTNLFMGLAEHQKIVAASDQNWLLCIAMQAL